MTVESGTAGGPALQAHRLSKTFVNRRVLNEVDLRIEHGEVVGLVGQNGCGKSTLIKILSGVYEPDPGGSLEVLGRAVPLPVPPGTAGSRGLAFVHQDLGLFLNGTVLENLRVGRYRTTLAWRIRWPAERQQCLDSLGRVGLRIDPGTMVRQLSQVDRALVAIARAVNQAAEQGTAVLVLDEPTSYLPEDGVERLFAAVEDLRVQGYGILFVSHRVDEILRICDRTVVLRDGSQVAEILAAEATEQGIVTAILGRSQETVYPSRVSTAHEADPALEVHEASDAFVDQVSFWVRPGEIYGVTGLLGMGQERLLYTLVGDRQASGAVKVQGRRRNLAGLTPRTARALGMALLPADRIRQSGVQDATVMENVTLPTLAKYVRFGRIRHGAERGRVAALTDLFDIRPPDVNNPLRILSGGNQQKALLAKWLDAAPAVLLLHEPTQGVDVGAKQQIFQILREAAAAGVAIVIATTEYEDLVGLCDRIMIMRNGRRASELDAGQISKDRLVEECYRIEEATL